MADFEKALKRTLGLEGDYSENKLDRGGKTRFGITEKLASAHGYKGEMISLPLDLAKRIYRTDYWDVNQLDRFPSQLLAENVFDFGVNSGPETSANMLQKTLNLLNKQGALWPDIWVDGRIGNQTLTVLQTALSNGCEMDLVKMYNLYRGKHIIEIGEANPDNEEFELGWSRNRIWLEVRK